jgi:hypothetical protein
MCIFMLNRREDVQVKSLLCIQCAGVLLMLTSHAALAQVGRYPGGGRGGSSTYPGGRRQPRDTINQVPEQALATFNGTVRSLDSKSLTLEGDQSQMMSFRCSKKTTFYDGSKKIKPKAIEPGAVVIVEGKEGPDGKPEAVNVRLQPAKKSQSWRPFA